MSCITFRLKEKSGWKVDGGYTMKKTNESMLDVISYGGYSNQLTDDYYPNNQVYNQLISELSKCKSGALPAYDDNNIFHTDKALTIKIEDIRVDNNIPISNGNL